MVNQMSNLMVYGQSNEQSNGQGHISIVLQQFKVTTSAAGSNLMVRVTFLLRSSSSRSQLLQLVAITCLSCITRRLVKKSVRNSALDINLSLAINNSFEAGDWRDKTSHAG